MERKRQEPFGIQVEIEGGKVRLTFPGGDKKFLESLRGAPKDISPTELAALTVMRLAIPLTFPEETTGVDQAGFRVEREKDIGPLPGGREEFYKDALTWAGAVLQGRGRGSNWVTKMLITDLPEHVRAGKQLGTISQDDLRLNEARLRRTVAGFYPGAAHAIEKGRKRKIPDW